MTNNTILKHIKELSDVAQHIAQHDINQAHKESVWHTMASDALDYKEQCTCTPSKQGYEEYLRPFEEEILALREKHGENVRKKDGSYCFTKVSHTSTYRSNKAVIGNAIEAGVLLTNGDSTYKSKTQQLEKEIKAKADKPMIDMDYQTALNHIRKLEVILFTAKPLEREALKMHIRTLL